ncbi:MAG TPA: hypothetical protein VGQ83_20610 [Polyangia bacterium]|jgi:hypothetical protein
MPRRGLWIYGSLDLLFAALYAAFALLGPGRNAAITACVLGLAALLAGSGVGLLAGGARWARRLAVATSVLLLAAAFLAIALLVVSAAYLRGVYGGFGAGAAVTCLVAAALIVELVGLLPIFQLRFLLRRLDPR